MSLSADERNAIIVVLAAIGVVVARISIGLPAALAIMIGAVLSLRPKLIVLALILFVAARAHQEVSELQALDAKPIERQTLILESDPRPAGPSWRAEASLGSHRIAINARGSAAAILRGSSVGDTLVVSGTLGGSTPRSGWALSHRIVGRLQITEVHDHLVSSGPKRWATVLRNHLSSGASGLDTERRALFTGLVYGDDREQGAITADNFRAAGLGHLLAVSGQNVLFVLLLATPLLSRIRSLSVRLVGTIVVLVAFGFVTRFEPSVSRALVMAGVAAVGSARGDPAGAVRLLPVAVVGLLLIDPLLGFSLAFQLSVCATLGLVVLSPRIYDLLDGPDALRAAISATMGAQLAVAPLLFTTFGSVSPLAIPANVLAGPAAAFVMTWGLTAGALAGAMPDVVAAVLHLPTRFAIWWIETVAETIASIPVASIGFGHLIAMTGGLAVKMISCSRTLRLAGAVVACVALVMPLLTTGSRPAGHHDLLPGLSVTRSGAGHDVVVLEGAFAADDILESLRTAHLGRIDLLIATDGSRSVGRVVRILQDRFTITETWAPPNHQVPGARVTPVDGGLVGTLRIDVGTDGSISVVESGPRRG